MFRSPLQSLFSLPSRLAGATIEPPPRYDTNFQTASKKIGKKHPNVIKDLLRVIDSLESGNFIGDAIPGFSRQVYKARVPSSDQKRGKRGGFRIVYYVVMDNRTI